MKKIIAAIIVALPLFAANVFAADTATPQQNKMAACSKENKGLKGEEFKKAQKECLSKDAAPAKSAKAAAAPADKPSQKGKMAACSKENKGLKGDEYKKAQKECLSK